MKHSLYYKFILGYLVFGLLGFASIATLSAQLMNKNQVKNQAEAMYDEANLIASAYSSVYQGKKQDLDSVYPAASGRGQVCAGGDLGGEPPGHHCGGQRTE